MKITIEKIDNGFILSVDEQEENLIKKYVYEERNEDKYDNDGVLNNNLTVIQNMFYDITEFFGIHYSKHNSRNLIIDIEENKEKE